MAHFVANVICKLNNTQFADSQDSLLHLLFVVSTDCLDWNFNQTNLKVIKKY